MTSASGVTVLELVNNLYMPALQCGIRPEDFWAMSVGELTDVIEAEMETRKQERKARISDAFVQAQAIAAYVMHDKTPLFRNRGTTIRNCSKRIRSNTWRTRRRPR